MPLLPAFDPPGRLDDFDRIPGQLQAWSRAVSGWFRGNIALVEMADPVAPRGPGGFDMVVGQNGTPGAGRERSCVLLAPPVTGTVTTRRDVVVPTAAGYFFSPSISALRDVITAPQGGTP